MMYGFLSFEQMKAFRAGDEFICFMAREETETGGRDIDGRPWFEPNHNHSARTFAEAAKELYRLRDKFAEEFPEHHMRLDPANGMGGLFLQCKNGRTIVLGFQSHVLDEQRIGKLRQLVDSKMGPKDGGGL